ncbi:MAG: hypothetical protein EOO14_16385 [Chitinophagaceae bacterium]|nr:MAG: hypothetical protein EOO14_16385 [Chitinophagaceae bacterium]
MLFFAALGVVWGGARLAADNPAASVFQQAAGAIGYRTFGLVMWCAAITSVIGASYTTISFFKTLHPAIEKWSRVLVSLFILTSTAIFLLQQSSAVSLLIIAGGVNGLILPIALALILLAARRKSIVGDYRHPLWMQVAGWLVVAVMTYMGAVSLLTIF